MLLLLSVYSWILLVFPFLGDRLDGYQKKKYVCKLVFIFLLGNDIDFGYQEAVNLLSSSRFSEKQIVSAMYLRRYVCTYIHICNIIITKYIVNKSGFTEKFFISVTP